METLSLEQQKAKLRNELRLKAKALDVRQREDQGKKILAQLLQHPRFLKARTVFTYLSMETEVETQPLLNEALRAGKKVFVPRIEPQKKRMQMIQVDDAEELHPGSYGILEPPFDEKKLGCPTDLELAIIPGMGFDREGGRLGRGKGYFDRFLAEAPQAYKIGLAFKFQIVAKIPKEDHDVLMDEVLIG